MGNLAKNTEQGTIFVPAVASSAYVTIACAFQLGALPPLLIGAGRDDTQGTPSAPSQTHPRPGILKDIFWPVTAGSRSFSMDCKYTGTAPSITIKQDPVVGVLADTTVAAGAGSGWVTITYSFTCAAAGVLQVWRQRTDRDLSHNLWWDNIVIT